MAAADAPPPAAPRRLPLPLPALALALALALPLTLAPSPAAAHSWIESASVVAPNGSFVGAPGFPRGYVPRTAPGWSDKQAQHLLPADGAYTGAEVLNKQPPPGPDPDPDPLHPLLRAAPGDTVAILHLENGHVTLPQNQPDKPLNRGTIFLYGTARPRPQERLFDVHLAWSADGRGGDARGRLLATRNYDDGQCFQDNGQPLARQRVASLAPAGARLARELRCQSTMTIPDDAAPGSLYTVYWYWDWPTLDPARVDMPATRRGRFPWAGSFMRRDPVPAGWSMDMIRVNESYASVIDIRITERLPGVVAKEAWVPGQDVYRAGIKAQVASSYDVDVGAAAKARPAAAAVPPGPPPAPAPAPAAAPSAPPGGSKCPPMRSTTTTLVTLTRTAAASSSRSTTTITTTILTTAIVTIVPTRSPLVAAAANAETRTPRETVIVTQTVTVPASTVLRTVYVLGSPARATPSAATADTEPSTHVVTRTTHVPAAASLKRHARAFGRR